MQFGSHTLTHPRLPTLTDDELAQELLESRRRLQARLGRCDALAYPFGVTCQRRPPGYRSPSALPPMSHAKLSAITIPRIPVKALKGAGARWVKDFSKANGGKRIRVERLVGHNARCRQQPGGPDPRPFDHGRQPLCGWTPPAASPVPRRSLEQERTRGGIASCRDRGLPRGAPIFFSRAWTRHPGRHYLCASFRILRRWGGAHSSPATDITVT